MSENTNKLNESLENNLNKMSINELKSNDSNKSVLSDNDINEDKSDYESCEESSDQQIYCETTEQQIEEILSEEEIEKRRSESNQLKSEGNECFRQKSFEESIEFYTKALNVCPKQLLTERSVIYANRSAARIHCNQLDEALDDSNSAIELNPNYVKAILRRAQIYRQMNDKLDEALKDYQQVIQLESNCTEAIVASNQLKIEINDRNERLKTEMMSKLKDLGNLVLRPFGLSTDNFKMNQNPETGGFSVNFQNN